MFERIKQVHFVGIGGSGMSGIAEVLLTLGYRVTGSDLRLTNVTDSLAASGAVVYSSHTADNVAGAHVVVRSSAVSTDNAELVEAEARKIPIISRAEMLAELARLKYTIAVAGTHGKTTTTSMIATIMDRAGMDPTFVVGGRLNTIGRNARLGKGEFIVVEADESDRSFLMLSPTIAVVTNIEADHLDHYRDLEDIQDAFVHFVNKVPFYGAVVIGTDQPAVQAVLPRIKRRVISFGVRDETDVTVLECSLARFGSRFTIRYNGGSTQECLLKVPGVHNVLNATAAFTAALEMGIDAQSVADSLQAFDGVERRFEIKSQTGVVVIDDYAHHPTEVRATLGAVRAAGFNKVLAAFQPHRYTRTHRLFEDFARAFEDADAVLITDIYPAGESPIEGVTSEALVARIKALYDAQVFYAPDFASIETFMHDRAQVGDAIVIMGAGSITRVSDNLARTMKDREPLKVNHE
jgi:UDP-N-acetylmuramate--alanine ligase